jgi:hypothetical protein
MVVNGGTMHNDMTGQIAKNIGGVDNRTRRANSTKQRAIETHGGAHRLLLLQLQPLRLCTAPTYTVHPCLRGL